MKITQTVKESYEWGYTFGAADYQPTVNTIDTDEQFAYVVGYIDGQFGDENNPEVLRELPRSEE